MASRGYSLISQEPEDGWEMVKRSSDSENVGDKHCWMSSMPNIYKATLGQVVWPGTHDSGAYLEEFDCSRVSSEDRLMKLASFALRCLGRRARRFASGWARAQQLSVKEQLEHGVRYLDLRVARCDRSGDYYITHSIGGPDLDDVLQQIAEFARKNSKEIILIRMCPRSGSVDHAELHEVVCRNLDELVLKKPQQELHPSPISYTLSQLVEEGRIVVFYASSSRIAKSNPQLTAFWSPDCIHNPWSYSLDPREKEEFQLSQYKSFRTTVTRHKHRTRLFNFQFVLTPTTKDVCKSLVYREPGRFYSLWDCAEHMNQRLGDFIDAVVQVDEQGVDSSVEEPGSGMIVSVDYVDRSELTDILVQMNRKYFGH